jgi:hypothetical protein
MAGALLVVLPVYLVWMVYYAGSPRTLAVGYQPEQPVPYSHALHAGELGIDCRYCHTTVEQAAWAAVPPTATCMNCHTLVAPESEKLLLVRQSAAGGEPIHWQRVHDLPDFVYFNHSAHVARGVGCVSCHGRVDKMERVYQAERLSMGWCLECHRNPEPHLRPREFVTDMTWVPGEDQAVLGARLRKQYDINPPTDCSTCHR